MDTPLKKNSLKNKNLCLLAKQNPSLAQKLAHYEIREAQIKVCRTAKERNLQVQHNPPFYIHSPQGPKKEAQQWFEALSLKNNDVIFIFGIGVGYHYKTLQPWLNESPNRYVLFIEPDLNVLSLLFETKLGTTLLEDKQVEIYTFPENEIDQTAFIQKLIGENILNSFIFCALDSYEREYSDLFSFIQHHISFERAEQRIYAEEMSKFGFAFFNNFYRNLFQLPSAYNGSALFGQFKNIPAIICGAGPSLLQAIPLLKKLKDQAILFGPGSAMNILNAHDILPHFGVHIDPTSETYHRVITQRAYEIPFFYRNRIYYEALQAIHGPHLFLHGIGLYNIAKWFEKQLGIPTDIIGEGYNVVNATIEIAHKLGCNPIIIVGLDHSFSEEHYATGIEKHPLFPSLRIEDKPHMGLPIGLKDVRGHPVKSYWPWIIEAHWCDHFHRTHPSVNMINATNGGIGLFSIPTQSLEEVSKQYLTSNLDLDNKIHQEIQKAGSIKTSTNEITKALHIFYESLGRCKQICEHRLEENKSEQDQEALKKNLVDEIGFIFFLQQFDEFYNKMSQRERRNLFREESEIKKIEMDKEIEYKKIVFLLQALKINIKMIENTWEENERQIQTKEETIHFENKVNLEPLERKTFFYQSGTPYSQQTYVKNLKEGLHIYYYPDGTLKSLINYRGDKLEGEVKLFYPNGHLKQLLHFVDGKREGIESSWYKNGQLFTEIEYVQNKPLKARCWTMDGKLIKSLSLNQR